MLIKAPLKPKILVVDDEPEAVELVEFNLEQAGFSVVTASDGAEALTKARSASPRHRHRPRQRREPRAASPPPPPPPPPPAPLARSFAFLFGSAVVARGAPFVANVALARSLSPAQFGVRSVHFELVSALVLTSRDAFRRACPRARPPQPPPGPT
jgi:CheY-like chemotaxis protein